MTTHLSLSTELPLGSVFAATIKVTKRLGTNSEGKSVYQCVCITCGRAYTYTREAIRIGAISPCSWCSTHASESKKASPSRLTQAEGHFDVLNKRRNKQ
jgi:hypothetical protein